MPVLVSIGPVRIYSMGLMMVLALLLAMFVVWKKMREIHVEDEMTFGVIFFGLFWGLIGARLGYIVSHFGDFGFSVLRWLWVTNYVGLSFFGGLLFGVVAVVMRLRSLGEEVFKWLDYISLGLSLGIGIGFLGAFLNGSYLGVESDLFLAMSFPGWERGMLPIQLFAGLAFLGFFGWWWRIEGKYRTFEWYRSGKVTVRSGFMWFGFLIFLGLVFGLTSLVKKEILTAFGFNLDLVISILVSLIGVGGIYLRSGRKLDEDLGLIVGRKRRQQRRFF